MDTEILETNELVIPKELNEYLESDNNAFSKIAEKINEISNKLIDLSKEKDDKEKEFEKRLEEFKIKLEEEIKDSDKLFDDREKELNDEKSRIESIKSEQESKKEKYVETLKNISDKYSSKISSIKTAIEACADNDSLKKALEEEETRLKEDLDSEAVNRNNELNGALDLIGINEVKKETKVEENKQESFSDEEYNKFMDILNSEISRIEASKQVIESSNNEVVMHEASEDVINEIYVSEEVMEGHVFPYLKGLLGE